MPQIIHIQTVIQTTFAEVDDEGNIVRTEPASVAIQKLDEASVLAAFHHLLTLRDQLKN